jgi:hypothetical protein
MSAESTRRTVSWGEALVVETFHTQGGLQAAVDAIVAEVGSMVGTRPTFAKLLHVQSPEELSDRNRTRAWLLLAALHREPRDWGLRDDDAPGSLDPEALKARLRARVRREGIEPPEAPRPSSPLESGPAGTETTRWYADSRRRRALHVVVPRRRLVLVRDVPPMGQGLAA